MVKFSSAVVATALCSLSIGALGAGAAQASVQVYGKTLAASCSSSAFAGRSDVVSLNECNTALAEEAMPDRDLAATHVNRGIILMRRGLLDAALQDFEAAAKIQPTMGEVYANRGSALVAQDRMTEAVADFDRALQLGVVQPERTYYNRGVAREWMNDTRGAYLDYRRAAQINPKWPDPQEQMVRFTIVRR
jgi:Tfp pilus assembly protein PilF